MTTYRYYMARPGTRLEDLPIMYLSGVMHAEIPVAGGGKVYGMADYAVPLSQEDQER